MGATDPSEVRESTATPIERPRAPPAGLPLAPQTPIPVPAPRAPGWPDPRPFIRRHRVLILRLLAVLGGIALLLLLWQGVAHSNEGGDRAAGESASDPAPLLPRGAIDSVAPTPIHAEF